MGKPDSGMERTTAISSSKTGFNSINLLLVSTMVVGSYAYFVFSLISTSVHVHDLISCFVLF